jgi:hypothetical protein
MSGERTKRALTPSWYSNVDAHVLFGASTIDVRYVARFFRKKVTATRIVRSLGRDLATQDQDRAIGSANRDEEIFATPETMTFASASSRA